MFSALLFWLKCAVTFALVAVSYAVVLLLMLKLKKLSTIGLRSIDAPSLAKLLNFLEAFSTNFFPWIEGPARRTFVDIEFVAVSRAMIPFYQGLTTESSFLCKIRFVIFWMISSSSTSRNLSWSLGCWNCNFWIFLSCFIIAWRICWTCFLLFFLNNGIAP